MAKRKRHLVSPYDCVGRPVMLADRHWTRCGRLLYHVEPNPKRGPLCKVCEGNRAKEKTRA